MRHFVNKYKFSAILCFLCAPAFFLFCLWILTQPMEDGVDKMVIGGMIGLPLLFVLIGLLNLRYSKKVEKYLEKIKEEGKKEAQRDFEERQW